MTSTKQYLWNYEVIKDSNNTTITTTSPVIIGRYGQNGGTGSAGKGITGITEYYLATSASSGVTTSTSGWTTAVQSTTTTNKYLWNYEVISYTSGNPYTSDPRIIGTYGDKGDKGVGVTSITKTGTSGTVDTYTIKYTDNTSTTFTVTNGTNGTNGTSAEWFCGTALTHTSGTATATISGAKVGDMYLNTATSNVYKCTAANTWTYAGNIADGVIGNISIGGRNLFGYGSDCQKTLAGMSQSGNLFSIVTEDGYLCAHASGQLQKTAFLSSKLLIIPKPNEQVVISCYVKIKNIVRGTTNPMCELYFEGQRIDGYWVSTRARKTYLDGKLIDASSGGLAFDRAITDEEWHHFAISGVYYNKQYVTPMLGAVYFRDATGDLYVRNIKFERGNIATDWTPAPEDVDVSIAAAQATANQKKQTFITTPTTPYYVGDIYFVDSKLLVCRTERLTGSYTADDWSEDLGYASANTVSDLENRTTSALDTITNEAIAKYKIYDDKLEGIEGRFNSKVQQTSENFLIQFDGLLRSLNALSNETREKFADYSKYFRFTAEGLEIGEEKNALSLVLDNDKISFRRNGVEFSYWDGSDNSFHVGDIIVDVNQVARFGSFGLVPLEGGDLAWKWLGGST